ncbi:hypothetical protein BYT27DRAFT_6378931 [Phlegmacium glaucopus]|nr:hypothetical protein BYT27DRAFT_6378931 [Phlegmacium glaucopus]
MLPKTKDDEEALIGPSSSSPTCDFRSTRQDIDRIDSPTNAIPPIEHSDNSLETTSPPPPVPKKKAVLIGIQNYKTTNDVSPDDKDNNPAENHRAAGEGRLKGPHNDVLDMRKLLLDCYGYHPDDITVLIDDCDPEHMQPTEENLIQSMKDLVADARQGDQFFLHYAGHGTQLPDDNDDEEDGLDECIITSDNKTIRDDELKRLLVAPLPVGSSFVAVLDSCHSGTLLDLMHHRCNRVYVPWVSKGNRRTTFKRNIITRQETQLPVDSDNLDTVQVPVLHFSEELAATESLIAPLDKGALVPLNLPQHAQRPCLSVTTHLSPINWAGSSATPLKYSVSPRPIYCTGLCRDEPKDDELMADVISLSATRDHQLTWEDSRGASLTEALIKVLRKDPHSSLKDVLTAVSYELQAFYVELHKTSRDYKYGIKNANIKRQIKGKSLLKSRTVEMNNFQNPELSSHRPLDMNRPWPL